MSATTRLTDPVWSHGGLTAIALISGAAVLGATQPGPFGRAVSLRPLVRIGELSYGIYLFHWPILVALRTSELSDWTIALVTIVGSSVLAVVSLRFLENPVRRRNWSRVRPMAVAIPLTVVIAGMAIWGGSRASEPTFDFSGSAASRTSATSPYPSRSRHRPLPGLRRSHRSPPDRSRSRSSATPPPGSSAWP